MGQRACFFAIIQSPAGPGGITCSTPLDLSRLLELPFSATLSPQSWGLATSAARKRARKRASHTTRNITIFGLIVIAIVIAAVVSSTPNPQFFMTIHIYDAPSEYTLLQQLPPDVDLVENATITITGPKSFGPEIDSDGIYVISNEIPGGTYTITAEKSGYSRRTIQYLVDGNCTNNQVLVSGTVVCHVLLRIIPTS